MNAIQINKALSNYVKYFKGIYPTDLLPFTLIIPSIIIINLVKNYMAGSHWEAPSFSDSGYAEYFVSYGLPTYKL